MNKIIIIFVMIIIIYLIFNECIEKFSGSDTQAIAQMASLYNSNNMTTTNMRVTNNLNTRHIRVNRDDTEKWPNGWGNGIHTWDLYSNASIATGRNGNITAFMNADGIIGADSINATRFNGTLSAVDTRNTNENPSYYRARVGMILEFKENNKIGLSNAGFYSLMHTSTPWWDGSGGPIHQIAYSQDGNVYNRFSKNESEWNEWKRQVTAGTTSDNTTVDDWCDCRTISVSRTFDRDANKAATCPRGYFMTGMFRHDDGCGDLNCIENLQCCKPCGIINKSVNKGAGTVIHN